MRFPESRILVFAKAPIPGQTKTRLIPRLGAEGAAKLQQQMILHTLEKVTSKQLCPVELWCSPTQDHQLFSRCRQQFSITLHTQTDGDLGERMFNAAASSLSSLSKARKVILIGTDCPQLNTQHLNDALTSLNNTNKAVIGPAYDGGYTLIGLNDVQPELFNDIEWGSSHVLAATRKRLHQLDWKWQELETLQDIDHPEDLAQLMEINETWREFIVNLGTR